MNTMEDLEEVRRRISQKKQQPVLTNHSFSRFYKFAISVMTSIAVIIAGGCILKTYPNIDLEAHILSLLPSFFTKEELPVNQLISYQQLGNNQYTSNDACVYAASEGVVINCSENSITVLYENGVSANYKGLATCFVEKNDHLTKDEKIATFENYFELILTENGQQISYETFASKI